MHSAFETPPWGLHWRLNTAIFAFCEGKNANSPACEKAYRRLFHAKGCLKFAI